MLENIRICVKANIYIYIYLTKPMTLVLDLPA